MGVWKDGWVSWLVDFVGRTRAGVGWADMTANLQRVFGSKLKVVTGTGPNRDRSVKNNNRCDRFFTKSYGCDCSFEDSDGCDCFFDNNGWLSLLL